MIKGAFCTSISMVLLFVATAYGQPSIQNLDGIWSDGSQMTITGGSFGSKNPAAPFLWDPVDGVPAYSGLSQGDAVPVQGDGDCPDCPWPNRLYTYKVEYYESGAGVRVPGKAVYRLNKSGGFQGLNLDLSGAGTIMYVNWWTMATKNLYDQGNGIVVNKLLRAWSTPDGTDGRTSWEVRMTMRKISDGSGGLESTNQYYAGQQGVLQDNKWSNIEATVFNQNISGSGGGKLTLDVDNHRWMNTGNDLASFKGPYDWIQAIGSSPHDASRYADGTYVYMGDIYVDNTVARVMAGDASTYSACTHKEIQIPVEWSNGEIVFSANTGSFSDGEPVYFYVINADNQVNETGWELTQEPVPGPGRPGQPEIN